MKNGEYGHKGSNGKYLGFLALIFGLWLYETSGLVLCMKLTPLPNLRLESRTGADRTFCLWATQVGPIRDKETPFWHSSLGG